MIGKEDKIICSDCNLTCIRKLCDDDDDDDDDNNNNNVSAL
jgi:hypothetical protein